jgi:cysteine sulfinate desulfinase/cysteine desulfurase-like protein
VPHLVCFAVGGVEPQAVLLASIAPASPRIRAARVRPNLSKPSPVLEAMGRRLRIARCASRSGTRTTRADVDAFADALPRIVADLRALSNR